jgi:hypothetical protein
LPVLDRRFCIHPWRRTERRTLSEIVAKQGHIRISPAQLDQMIKMIGMPEIIGIEERHVATPTLSHCPCSCNRHAGVLLPHDDEPRDCANADCTVSTMNEALLNNGIATETASDFMLAGIRGVIRELPFTYANG